MKIVIDTNIVFSAILNSQSRIGQILLISKKSLKFYSPRFLQTEIQNHLQRIRKITKLDESELLELITTLYTKINFIEEEFIPKESLLIAEGLTGDIDFDDSIFVALALHLNCKLWTGDKFLVEALTKKGFTKFISTKQLIKKIEKN